MQISVAPIWRYEPAFSGPKSVIEGAGIDVAWEDRPKVTVDVTQETTTAELMTLAGRALILVNEDGGAYGYGDDGMFEPYISRIAFYSDTAEDHFADLEVMLADDGSATWSFERPAVTVGRILKSHEAGLLPGDPLRAFFILDYQTAGGGGLWDIPAIGFCLQVLQYALTAHGAVSATRDTYTLVKRFREWFVRDVGKRETFKRYKNLFAIPRTTEQVATLLKVPKADVPTICHFLGMKFIDRAWRSVNTPETRERNELLVVMDDAVSWDLDEHFTKRAFAEILGLPVGSRAQGAGPIVNKMTFEQQEGL